jgi:hypothetical protein
MQQKGGNFPKFLTYCTTTETMNITRNLYKNVIGTVKDTVVKQMDKIGVFWK